MVAQSPTGKLLEDSLIVTISQYIIEILIQMLLYRWGWLPAHICETIVFIEQASSFSLLSPRLCIEVQAPCWL